MRISILRKYRVDDDVYTIGIGTYREQVCIIAIPFSPAKSFG